MNNKSIQFFKVYDHYFIYYKNPNRKTKNSLFVQNSVKKSNRKNICAHPNFVICIQDKHLMSVYLYYFFSQSMIRVYKFLDTWSKCCDQRGQLSILWKNSKYRKAKTTNGFIYEFESSHLYLSKGILFWHFFVSNKALRFLKNSLLNSLSRIKPALDSRYSDLYLGILFVQIFILIHSFLEILVINIQAHMFFVMSEPTSKAIYKNFIAVLIAGKLFEIFLENFWKIFQSFEYRVSKFYSISKKISVLRNFFILTLILLVVIGVLNNSFLLPDIVYLKYIWNIPTYRILMITSIFFFKNSFVQCFSQCWFFSNTSHIFNCFQHTLKLPECKVLHPFLTIFSMYIFIIFLLIWEWTRYREFVSEVLWVDNKIIHEQCGNSESNSNTIKEYINLQF